MEAAIVEPIRRSGVVRLHESLMNAPLIYDTTGRDFMGGLYLDYIATAQKADLPILVCTPTWRANQSRVRESNTRDTINRDAVDFLRELRHSVAGRGGIIKIGGTLGCKNDCYRPDQALSVSESQKFHSWQVEQLALGGVDFLIAETLPNVDEALGIAKAMQSSGVPYIISFVISRDGRVLDGHNLRDAIAFIDSKTKNRPLGYMVNCAHPSFLCPGQQDPELFNRLIGYQANASSLDHCDLDNAERLEVDSVPEWGDLMLDLNRSYGVQILGGCCGTGKDHLKYLVS